MNWITKFIKPKIKSLFKKRSLSNNEETLWTTCSCKNLIYKEDLKVNLTINFGNIIKNNSRIRDFFNNDGRLNFDGVIKKSSRYKFSKIEKFDQFEPVISFDNKNIIFFDDKGSILKFNDKSELIWKKNHYLKLEKKLKPVLQFANDE